MEEILHHLGSPKYSGHWDMVNIIRWCKISSIHSMARVQVLRNLGGFWKCWFRRFRAEGLGFGGFREGSP